MDRPEPLSQNWIKIADCEPAEKLIITLTDNGQTLSILDLPVEIILYIFKYLSPYSLLRRVALVCKSWNNLSKDRTLWKCLTLDFHKFTSFNFSNKCIKFPYLQKLSIQQGNIGKDFALLELSNLQHMSLTFCNISEDAASAFENIFNKNASSITLLNLEGSEVCSDILDKIFILKSLKHLNLSHCLHLQNSSLIKILNNCPWLEVLDLDGINFLDDYAINSIFQIRGDTLVDLTVDGDHLSDDAFLNLKDCRKLSTLNIAFCENLTDNILHQVMHFEHLKTLKLRKGCLFSSCGLNSLFNDGNLFNITHLNMAECSLLNNSNLIAVANCCHRLISLNLSWCWELTDESVCYLVKKCPFIIIMNITGLVRIQGDFTQDLKQGLLKNLRVIDLDQCGGVKDELLIDLHRARPNLKIFGFWGDLISSVPSDDNDE